MKTLLQKLKSFSKITSISFMLICLMGLGASLQAQNLSGKVTDEDGSPLIGASVLAKGTQVGALTDADGNFKLDVPTGADSVLISYVGYAAQAFSITGKSAIDVSLVASDVTLDDVVITSLGIAREAKTLGYAAQEVEGQALTQARETNFVNGLSGRVAGVDIRQGASGVGSSAIINIRGETSISGSNQPLFVVDGVPISNDIFSTRSEGNLEVDYGNAAGEINPDDIESVTVLKGANATALYGSRALNGVVLISTKSGKGQKGLGVTVNSTTTWENPLRIPEYQNEYGQGANGQFSFVNGSGAGVNDGVDESWGPRIEGQMIPQHDSPTANGFRAGDSHPSIDRGEISSTPWLAHPDNIKNFFETGVTTTNNFAIAGSNENGDFRLSYTNLYSEGIVPNTDLRRHTIGLSSSFKPVDNLTFRVNANYIDQDSDNRPTNSYGTENVMYLWVWFGRHIPMASLRDYWQPGLEGVQQFNYNYNWHDNPYFTQFENTNGQQKDRLYGNISVTYDFTDKLKLMLRTGTDYFNELRIGKRGFSTQRFPFGQYREDAITFQETNTDFLLTYEDLYNGDFGYSVSVGGNTMQQKRRYTRISANQLSVPEVYNFENSRIPLNQTQFNTDRQINSLYATAQFSFKNWIYLDLSGRNDWASALTNPIDADNSNNSYFYPAVNLSAVISDMTSMPSVITFLKLRAGYGEVGGDTDPYRLSNVYNFLTPWGSTQRVTENNSLANADLRPERAQSLEIGADVRFFDNRLGVDIAYYNTNTKDQIFALDIPQSTGYSSRIVNAGKINSYGFEVQLNANPIKLDNGLRWDVNVNWSMQRSKVVELVEGIENYTITGNYITVQAREGGRMGDMFGTGFVMIDDNGNRLLPDELGRLPEGGRPLMNDNGFYVRDNNLRHIGNYNPDFMLGLYNNISYKGFNLGFLFDWRHGGEILSRTLLIGSTSGMMIETVGDNERGNPKRDPIAQGGGVAPEGVFQDADGNYIDNYSLPEGDRKRLEGRDYYWWTFNRGNETQGIYDASYIKLREVKLGYTLPNSLTGKIGVNDVRVSVVGRNLLLWTENPHFDPETFSFNGNSVVRGVEDMATPSSRSYGVNVGFKF